MLAPGKVNLCLLVGAPRADGLHPLVSVVQPTQLGDEVTLEPAGGDVPRDGPARAAATGATSSSAPASRATTSPPAPCASSAPRRAGTARRSG